MSLHIHILYIIGEIRRYTIIYIYVYMMTMMMRAMMSRREGRYRNRQHIPAMAAEQILPAFSGEVGEEVSNTTSEQNALTEFFSEPFRAVSGGLSRGFIGFGHFFVAFHGVFMNLSYVSAICTGRSFQSLI